MRWTIWALGILFTLSGCEGGDESSSPRDAEDLGGGRVEDRGVRRDARVVDATVDSLVVDAAPDLGPAPCVEGTIETCADCNGSTRACEMGQWLECETPTERCNGEDDDCDGRTDETFADLNIPCASGRGACSQMGRRVCAADGLATQCDAVASGARAEACNRVDDDCDGQADEQAAFACYTGSAETRGLGLCADGEAQCEVGAPGDCRGSVLPSAEVCNAFDDDCDGFIDEDAAETPCYSGPLDTRGVGLCLGGVRACEAGVAGVCTDEVRPALEICDARDNNCDGQVDEGLDCRCPPGAEQACYTGPAGTDGVGACRMGSQTCGERGMWGACVGERGPEAELCDGVDGDCNGAIDDQIAGVGAMCFLGRGACRAEGLLQCDSAVGQLSCDADPASPVPERCDREDNDCDGRTDEGLNLGAECSEGRGLCVALGRLVCAGDGSTRCEAPQGAPVPELCNGLDDDCDGQSDEDFALGADCAQGRGRCERMGVRVCDGAGQAVCSVQAGDPAPEACDGTDEDCDGRADEGNPGGGQDCNSGQPGSCAAGQRTCVAGVFGCTPSVRPAAEVCDGLDNDCDGPTDEDAAGGPLALVCYEGSQDTLGVGRCRAGQRLCAGGFFGGCAGQILPGQELCNLMDDDCDGAIDEDLVRACVCRPGEDVACYSGPPGTLGVGACVSGLQRCQPDGQGFGPCAGEGLPGLEQCDGIDNDCNSLVDDVPGVGQACQVGQGICEGDGALRCRPDLGRLACDAEPGPQANEVCNGLDDDCDGLVDDVAGVGTPCGVGRGACTRAGNQVCPAVGPLVCSAEPGQPSPETCDREDDDCDGLTDEGVPGVGERCTAGQGQCRRAGANVCDGARGLVVCDVLPAGPSPEICNGLDEDCDGRFDEDARDAGTPCNLGVGSCTAAGARQCLGGVLTCDAQPGQPGLEVCDLEDNDCDSRVDEGLECRAFLSCQDALDQGFVASGVYRLDPDGDGRGAVDVWCDQTTDGGGWTLVVSNHGQPPNDAAANWNADLSSMAPVAAHPGVWSGMRPRIPAGSDLRFACRQAPGGALSVDLSFYAVPWYREMTTGDDAASCFSEAGQPDPAPARRNNRTGEVRAPGQGWHAEQGDLRTLEGEDSCADVGDFTVDFEDRGMDSNQSDGTDWGKDDGAFKCGRNGVAGEWFLFTRETRGAPLGRVAVLGAVNVAEPLRAAGFEVTVFDLAALPAPFDLRPFDVVFLGRIAQDWALVGPTLINGLDGFSRSGGHLITEYDGAALLALRYQDDFRFLPGAHIPLAWFPLSLGGGAVVGLNTPITPVLGRERDPILRSLSNPLRGGIGTERFFTVTALDQGIPLDMMPIARFPGVPGSQVFPAATYPAVLRGTRCGGNVFLAVFDYQDRPLAAPMRQLVANLAASAFSPPLAEVPDLCP